MRFLTQLAFEERGEDLIEYGLLAAFISISAVAAIGSIGESINTMYAYIASQVSSWP